MNILLLDMGDEFRGGQRQVLHLLRYLDGLSGRRAGLAAPAGSPIVRAATEEDLSTHTLPGRRDLDPRNLIALRKILRGGNYGVLHTNDARGASLGALAKKFTPGLRLVHTRRVSYPLKSGWSSLKYRKADAVAAVSREVAEALKAGGVDPARIVTIHSGVDPGGYNAREAGPRDEVVFGLIGAFTPQKGVEVFLGALAEVGRVRPDLKWRGLAVGDGPLMEELKALAAELGIAVKVGFPGYVDSREALPGIDILAVPSMHGEGSSATIKEGWASRTPVVCSDLPANLELVEHERSGLVAPRGDAKALAGALVRLAEDRELAEGLAARGAERVQDFTVRRMAEAYLALYERLEG